MNVTASLISLFVGLIIPAAVAFITKQHVSAGLKAFLTALFSAVSGGLSGALTTAPRNWAEWQAIAWPILLAWIAAGVTYLTGWKPAGATDWIEAKFGRFGVGTPRPPVAGSDAGTAQMATFLWVVAFGLAVWCAAIRSTGWAIFFGALTVVVAVLAALTSRTDDRLAGRVMPMVGEDRWVHPSGPSRHP